MATKTRRPYAPRLPLAERREQLLDAALEVLARDGYAGLTIDSIAREAGVTRPVVYGAFDRLDDLLSALLDRQESRALEQLLAVLPLDQAMHDPDAFLVAAVGRLIETVTEDPLTWRPILLAPEGTPPAVRARIDKDRELVRARMQSMLEMGLALRGGLELDTEMASHALIGVAEHFGRLIVDDPEHFEPDRITGMVATLLAALSRPA